MIAQNTLAEPALSAAVNYLVNNYNSTVGLIPDVPGGNTYWLYSDNFLASLALERYDSQSQRNLTITKIAANINSNISKYIAGVPNVLNQYMALNSSTSAFNNSRSYTVSNHAGAVINITLNNGPGELNQSNFADIAFLKALYYNDVGYAKNATDSYQIGVKMYDGNGMNDSVFQSETEKGQYQTFKLALYIYASKIFGYQFPQSAEAVLLRMQGASGGFYTGYDANFSSNGTYTNVETTSLAILALLGPFHTEPFYILADGSVSPSSAPILRNGNYYTLTGNITSFGSGIVIQKSNITIDGAGYTLYGSGTSSAGNLVGFYLNGVNHVTIKNSTITNFNYGVWLVLSPNNTVSGDNVTNNEVGIELYYSSDSNIVGNVFVEDGLMVVSSFGNVVSGNLVNSKPLIYLEDASDRVVKDAGQVVLVNCTRMTIENLTLSHTDVGIELWNTNGTRISGNNETNNQIGVFLLSSFGNTVTGNNATSNNVGVVLAGSSNNAVSGNDIRANNGGGMTLISSFNNDILGNTITNNPHGIEFSSSSNNWGNVIYHNNFINNNIQVYSILIVNFNFWDDGYPSGGNYWSNYNSTDSSSGPGQNKTGSDGIGDTPYAQERDNSDNYPLMAPFHTFTAGTWNGTTYDVDGISNSTLSNFSFNSTVKTLTFSVTGTNGTGFCRVAIPKALMWCDNETQWAIQIAGLKSPQDAQFFYQSIRIVTDANCTYIYFAYPHSTHTLLITSTHAVLEFQPFFILPLLMIATLLAALVFKRRRNSNPKTKSTQQRLQQMTEHSFSV